MARAPVREAEDDGPSPRAQAAFVGHAEAEAEFLAAIGSGRMHHAWLIGGPPGIGKATLAYRVARYVLDRTADGGVLPRASAGEPAPSSLAVQAERPAAHLIAGGAHPDLLVIERAMDDAGKRRKAEIGVAEVRRLIPFFGSTAARGGMRVCIVDAADDLNGNAANALLKALEEPPTGGLFLIVSHAPGRLLPTIRSRCRRLMLEPLSPAEIAEGLAGLGFGRSHGEAEIAAAAEAAEGSMGRAIDILGGGRLDLMRKAGAMLAAVPTVDRRAVMALADVVSARGAEDAFSLFVDVVRDHLARTVRAAAAAGGRPAALAAWAEVWEKVDRAVGRAEALNLDRKQVVLGIFRDLAEASRRASTAA